MPILDHIGLSVSDTARAKEFYSRALAPLDRLVALARAPLEKGVKAVFLKGEEWADELTAAERLGRFSYRTIESRTHPRANDDNTL